MNLLKELQLREQRDRYEDEFKNPFFVKGHVIGDPLSNYPTVGKFVLRCEIGTEFTAREGEIHTAHKHAVKRLQKYIYKDIIERLDGLQSALLGCKRDKALEITEDLFRICNGED